MKYEIFVSKIGMVRVISILSLIFSDILNIWFNFENESERGKNLLI